MKTIKLADLVIQVFLFICTVVFAIFRHGENESLFYPYFAVGGWQLFSFILHFASGTKFIRHYERINYGKIILLVLIAGIAFLGLTLIGAPFILYYLFGLLLVSPILATWYFTISFRELKLVYKREFIHLK